jgi:hypothetical protein
MGCGGVYTGSAEAPLTSSCGYDNKLLGFTKDEEFLDRLRVSRFSYLRETSPLFVVAVAIVRLLIALFPKTKGLSL